MEILRTHRIAIFVLRMTVWSCSARLSVIQKELVLLLRKFLGVENANQRAVYDPSPKSKISTLPQGEGGLHIWRGGPLAPCGSGFADGRHERQRVSPDSEQMKPTKPIRLKGGTL